MGTKDIEKELKQKTKADTLLRAVIMEEQGIDKLEGQDRIDKKLFLVGEILKYAPDPNHLTIDATKEYIKAIYPERLEEFEERAEIIKEKKGKIEVELPKSGRLISSFINDIIDILSEKKILFYRSDARQVVEVGEIEHKNKENKKVFTGFIVVKPSRFITLVEKIFTPCNKISFKKHDCYFSEFKPKSMTKDLSNTVIDSPILEKELPRIDRIFTSPLPIIYDGKLTFPKVGYDNRFNSWLPSNSPKIDNPKMSLKESKKVLHLIIEEFCFKTDYDYNLAIAGLLTSFLRGLYHSFNCRTPLFIYLANRERVGKDYLAKINGLIYEGIALEEPPISVTKNKGNSEEELRKKLLSSFLAGRKRLHFSNNKGKINNAVFEQILTTETYSDRLLGKNDLLAFDNEMEFSLSGNLGIGFTPDLANRSRIITQFFSKEDTNTRKFKNPNLHKWVLENRNLILSAMYGLVRNWFDNSCPDGKLQFASFPEWARVCGGIMESAGYESPCNISKEDLTIGGDTETTDMKQLFEICYENSQNTQLSKKDIKDLIEGEDIFTYFDFTKRSDQIRFGNAITKFDNRILSDIRMRIVDKSIRSARQQFIFTKEEVEICNENGNGGNENGIEEDIFDEKPTKIPLKVGNGGNGGNVRAIDQCKHKVLDGTVVQPLPRLPPLPNIVYDYIKTNPECSLLDIQNTSGLSKKETKEEVEKLKEQGDIFEPMINKYMIA